MKCHSHGYFMAPMHHLKNLMGHEYVKFSYGFMGIFIYFSRHKSHGNVINLTIKILWKTCGFTMNCL